MKPLDRVEYAHLVPTEFRRRLREAPIAYLPLGTLEWHGEHLPLGSDGLQAQGFFVHLAREVGGIVLPLLFLGPDKRAVIGGREFYGMDIYGFEGEDPHQLEGSAYWLGEKLFAQLLEAIIRQLARAGFKILVAHGHTPSTDVFVQHMAEWSGKYRMMMFHCRRGTGPDEDPLGIQTDHAGANETSLMMALHPDLVRMDYLSEEPIKRPLGILGKDPRTNASAEIGQEAIMVQGERMAGILRQALSKI